MKNMIVLRIFLFSDYRAVRNLQVLQLPRWDWKARVDARPTSGSNKAERLRHLDLGQPTSVLYDKEKSWKNLGKS